MKEQFCLLTDLLMRIDKTDKIQKQIKEGFVTFGCPANWIDYAKKHEDGIADKYEAICGHVAKDDFRLSMLGSDGIPLNSFRSFWYEEGPLNTVYVRYIYHCLTPALCFYSVQLKDTVKRTTTPLIISLDDYYKSLGIKQEECSILVILEVNRFFADLRAQIPKALYNNNNINTDNFDESTILLCEEVDYTLDLDSQFFNVYSLKDIFRKLPKFASQREARLVIPGVFFTNDPVYNLNAYKNNKLDVYIPNFSEYAHIMNAENVNYIIAGDYNDKNDDFGIVFLREL